MLLCFPLELEWIKKNTSESQMSQQGASVTTTVMKLACEQAFRGTLAVGRGEGGRGKEGELATMSLECEFQLQFPCCSLLTELSDFLQSVRSIKD